MTLNDKSRVGEVVIVQRPHRGNYKVFQYGSLWAAFETWIEDVAVFYRWDNFSQVEKEYEGDDDLISFLKDKLLDAGIGLDEPFVEYAVCNGYEVQLLSQPVDKEALLHDIVSDDMHAGHVFISEGQSYDEWFDEIVNFTKGHNQVSKEVLAYTLNLEFIEDLDGLNILIGEVLEEDDTRLNLCTPRQAVIVHEIVQAVKALGEYWRDDISLTDEAYEIIESKFADFMCQL